MSRIQLTDNSMDIFVKMSDGNPGALSVLMEIQEKHDSIDPQAVMGPLGAILALDMLEIYGTDIYVLFNDKCNRCMRTMLMLMRAVQLGFFSSNQLRELAADQRRIINITDEEISDLDALVCERLSEFEKIETIA